MDGYLLGIFVDYSVVVSTVLTQDDVAIDGLNFGSS